jgi:hypothetical protein
MVSGAPRGHVFMKVIFLDIDGVLNCHKTPNPRKFPYVIDDGLLARFRQLIERTGASVVLSSVNRPFNCGSLSSRFLTSLLSPPAVALAPSELVGVAETGRAPVGDAIASHTVI